LNRRERSLNARVKYTGGRRDILGIEAHAGGQKGSSGQNAPKCAKSA